MPDSLPVFRFAPVFREYLWGGRRLGDVLNKPIGDGPTYAESWEVVDHGQDQSVVLGGAFDGWTLSKLVQEQGELLLGKPWYEKIKSDSVPAHLQLRFPLLIKWLDANRDLSIQVHPNDQQAALLSPPDLGKTEAWFIADALPGSKVYAGLKAGVDQSQFEAALAENRVLEVMHSFEPKVGDCLFIPAGTVHALGAGLLVAEVQQASNTTYRIYDWDRVGPDGQPRQLHVQQSVAVADYQSGPVKPVSSTGAEEGENLVACNYFEIDQLPIKQPRTLPGGVCQMLICVGGSVSCHTEEGEDFELQLGQTVLVPHCCSGLKLSPAPEATLLIARLPAE